MRWNACVRAKPKHARSNPTNDNQRFGVHGESAPAPHANRIEAHCRNVALTSLHSLTHSQHARCALLACSRCAYSARHNSRSGIDETHTHSHCCVKTSLAVPKTADRCRARQPFQHAVQQRSATPQLHIALVMRLKQDVRQCGQIADAVRDGTSHASTA
jgi:hypothetical protein